MDTNTAIKELNEMLDGEIRFGDWSHHREEVTRRTEAILYAIRSIRQCMECNDNKTEESEIKTEDNTVSEKDVIYRQAAIEYFVTNVGWVDEDDSRVGDTDELRRIWTELFDGVPSAQPEIIRCKDCKWYGRADKRRFYRGMDCLKKRIDTIVPDRDYCSRAERRTDETD